LSLNRVMIIGNLVKDPEIRYTPSGVPIVNFSLATDESYIDRDGNRQEHVAWHRIVTTGKLALTCREYLKKGRQAFVEGRIRYAQWDDASNGRKHHRTEIIAARVQFLGPQRDDDTSPVPPTQPGVDDATR